jgi:hypothetical protein
VTTVSLVAAATLALVFRLALRVGASLRGAFLAWLGAAFSGMFVSYAASPFPEMSGAFFTTAAVFLLAQERPPRAVALAGLCLAALVGVKTRLFVLVPPLLLGFLRRLSGWTLLAVGGVLVAALALASAYDAWLFGGNVLAQVRRGGTLGAGAWLLAWTVRAPLEYRGHLGLLFDQEFGLLLIAPVFFLAVAGVVVAARERRGRLLLLAGAPFAVAWYYLGAVRLGGIAAHGVSLWYGGFSPPARFLMAALPPFAIFVALAVDRLRGWLGWGLVGALYTVSVGYAAVISVWPAWRFQAGLGRATVLLRVFRHLGVDPGRLLPSFLTPAAGAVGVGCAGLVLTALAGYRLGRRRGGAPPRGAVALGALGALLGATALTGAAWWAPTGRYPAVLGVGRGGSPFLGLVDADAGSGPEPRARLVWAGQHEGALKLAPRLWPGHYRILVRAGGQASDGAPALTVQIGADPPQRVTLRVASPPAWREDDYGFEVRWEGGRLPIRLGLTLLSRADPVRLAYLDAVAIRPLPP